MRFKANDLSLTHEYGVGWRLSVRVTGDDLERAKKGFDELKADDLAVVIEKWRDQRSLSANAYFHKLVSMIAMKIDRGEDEVKRNLICDYGAQEYRDGSPIFLNLPVGTDPQGLGIKYAKWFAESTVNGRRVDCFIVYRGSHTYDSKEMSRLISGAEQEAKNVGITDLLRKEDVERMLDEQAYESARNSSKGQAAGLGS